MISGFDIFTQGQFWPSDIVVACVARPQWVNAVKMASEHASQHYTLVQGHMIF